MVCGALWVVVSLSFMLAAGASTETERAGFTARVALVLNRVNLAALAILPLSGIANLVFVARERHYRLPAAFVEVLGAKVLLPKLQLPGTIGFIAQIVDSEGNRVGLHSAAA